MSEPEVELAAAERWQQGLALIRAARQGLVDEVRERVAGHAELVNWVDRTGGIRREPGRTALWAAADAGHVEIVRTLLDAGAAVDAHDPRLNSSAYEPKKSEISRSLLHHVAFRGSTEMLRLLVERGMTVGARDEDGNTPLHAAATSPENIDALRALLELGADPRAVNQLGEVPLQITHDESVTAALLEAGADPDPESPVHSPLVKAIRYGDAGRVRRLLEGGADPQRLGVNGVSPLRLSAQHGRTECARVLLERGVAVDGVEGENMTPLASAARAGHLEVLELLLESGARDVDVALHEAAGLRGAELPREACVRKLLDAGADVHRRDGAILLAPIHRAASSNNATAIQLFLEAGAELEARDRSGATALWHACEKGSLDAVTCLLAAGAEIGAKNDEGRAPWQAARMTPEGRAIKKLLDQHGSQKKKTAPVEPAPPGVDDRVQHAKFGEGVVSATTGTGEQLKLEVYFVGVGPKQILARFVKRI